MRGTLYEVLMMKNIIILTLSDSGILILSSAKYVSKFSSRGDSILCSVSVTVLLVVLLGVGGVEVEFSGESLVAPSFSIC